MLNALKFVFSNDRKDSISEKNRDYITRLKFIGTFQPNEKIDVKNLKIENNTIITPFKRMLLGESRDTTYQFLSSTIDRSFEIVNSYCRSDKISEKLFCKNILNDMIKAITGLQNIQKTYKDDKLFYCNIEVLIESVQSKLMEIKDKCPDLYELKTLIDEECEIQKPVDQKDVTVKSEKKQK